MIPKVIHYCWFGRNSKPEIFNKCLKSWKKHCPDYQIIEWNEDNVDLDKFAFAKEALEHKKFAFVSDQVRFNVLYNHGGIYLDTDVELIKPLDDLLTNQSFMGIEIDNLVNPGLIVGAVAKSKVIKEFVDLYDRLEFINSDLTLNLTTVVTYASQIINKIGKITNTKISQFEGITIYPIEYFNPIDIRHTKKHLSKNTYSIHHYQGSWLTDGQKKRIERTKKIKKILGNRIYNILSKVKLKLWRRGSK